MEEVTLDVRATPHWERHARIFAEFDGLKAGGVLVVLSDHEPRPLRAEFDERRSDRFVWMQRQLGDGNWEVRIEPYFAGGPEHDAATMLARSSVFRSLGNHDIEHLAYRSRRVTLRRGQPIVDQSLRWPYLGFVEAGMMQAILITTSGRDQAMYDILPCEIFGEIALLDDGHTPLRFVAVTHHTSILMLPTQLVRAFAREHDEVRSALEIYASQHFRAVLARFSTNLSGSTTSRVAAVLLPYARPSGGLTESSDTLRGMTQSDLALRAGTVKEIVNRALAELETAGAIERVSGRIVRLDREKLAEHVNGSRIPSHRRSW